MSDEYSLLLDFFAVVAIIAVTAFFVVAEIAILTSSRPKLHHMIQKGNVGAKRAVELTKKPDILLSTTQVGITLMNLLLGLFGGISITEHIAALLEHAPYISKYSYIAGYAVSLLLITYLTVLGEVIPKRIALMHSEKAAALTAWIMQVFIKILYPFVMIITISIKGFMHVFRIKEKRERISPEEIKYIINQAGTSGTIDTTERDMICRLINLSSMRVGAIMTPRNKIIALDLTRNSEQNLETLHKHTFSCFPLIDGEINKLRGIVYVKKLLNRSSIDNDSLLNATQPSPITYIPEIAKVSKLMEIFCAKQTKIAVVLDEYGDVEGIVTFTDILKTFLGDISRLVEGRRPDIFKKQEDVYIVSGNVLIDEIMEQLELSSLPGDDIEEYRTLASFILKQLGTIPKAGDLFVASGWEFKILKMDKFRIDRVKIVKIKMTS